MTRLREVARRLARAAAAVFHPGPIYWPHRVTPRKVVRCRNCPTPIRYSGHPTGGWLDARGWPTCGDTGIPHQPMPEVAR